MPDQLTPAMRKLSDFLDIIENIRKKLIQYYNQVRNLNNIVEGYGERLMFVSGSISGWFDLLMDANSPDGEHLLQYIKKNKDLFKWAWFIEHIDDAQKYLSRTDLGRLDGASRISVIGIRDEVQQMRLRIIQAFDDVCSQQ